MKKYYIEIKRHYYGPESATNLLRNEMGHIWEGTYKEAKEEIEAMESAIYYLSHNESGRPDYSIVGVDSIRGKRCALKFNI